MDMKEAGSKSQKPSRRDDRAWELGSSTPESRKTPGAVIGSSHFGSCFPQAQFENLGGALEPCCWRG